VISVLHRPVEFATTQTGHPTAETDSRKAVIGGYGRGWPNQIQTGLTYVLIAIAKKELRLDG
jgi:hypothetical protein